MAFTFRSDQKIAFFRMFQPFFAQNATGSARARKQNFSTHGKRARVRKILTSIYGIGREGRPRLRGAARARARARARALSTRDFQNSHFLLYNFQNNQGKSCLASRVWQLCKISAQSEPISMSYDRNNFRFLNPNSFL